MHKTLHPQPLTAESFQAYGKVLQPEPRPAEFTSESGTRGWRFPFVSGSPALLVLDTPYRAGPPTITALESHSQVTQTFIPAGGSPAVLVVAAPSEETPDPGTLKAFFLDGSAGYLLFRRTWHSLDRIPLHGPGTTWVMLTDCETQEDLSDVARGTARFTRQVDLRATWGYDLAIELWDLSWGGTIH